MTRTSELAVLFSSYDTFQHHVCENMEGSEADGVELRVIKDNMIKEMRGWNTG